MVERSSQVHFSTGTLGPLSLAELRKLNAFLKNEVDPGNDTGLADVLNKVTQYFDHVIANESQVGRIG